MTVEEIKQRALEAEDKIKGTTVNERLYISGLTDEFYKAIESDDERARLILSLLHVGEESITEILKKNWL